MLTLLEESAKKCNIRAETNLFYSNLITYIKHFYNLSKKCDESLEITNKLMEKLMRTAKKLEENFLKMYHWSTLKIEDVYDEIKVLYKY